MSEMTVGELRSGTCTSCGERMLLTDWQEHREQVHGFRSDEASA